MRCVGAPGRIALKFDELLDSDCYYWNVDILAVLFSFLFRISGSKSGGLCF